MNTVTLFVGGGLLAAAVVLYVLLPLVRGQRALLHRTEEEGTEEEYRRRLALSALRDVEYDYATGKLDDEDYRILKGELSVEALRILEGETSPGGEAGDETTAAGAGADEPDDALEAEIARIREGLEEGRTCRACAHVNPSESRFCGRCGQGLQRADPEPVSAGEE